MGEVKLLDLAFSEKSTVGYCTVVVGKHRMGVVIVYVCVCVLLLELSH